MTTPVKVKLVGQELLDFVAGREPTNEIITEAGYCKVVKDKTTHEPRIQVNKMAFLTALSEATGAIPTTKRSTALRPRSYMLKPSKTNGSLVISVGYLKEVGGTDGSYYKVSPDAESGAILLTLASEEEAAAARALEALEASEPEPQGGEPAAAPACVPGANVVTAPAGSALLDASAAAAAAPLPVAV